VWTQYFKNEWTTFDANWHKWSTGKCMKWSTLVVRRLKIKVTRGLRWILIRAGGIIVDPFGQVGFQIFYFIYQFLFALGRSMADCHHFSFSLSFSKQCSRTNTVWVTCRYLDFLDISVQLACIQHGSGDGITAVSFCDENWLNKITAT